MAEFVTRAENTRRLIVIVVCVILDTLFIAGGILWFKNASDIENGEKNSKSIVRLQAKVKELEDANRASEQNVIEFAQPIGWRTHASWTTDRLVTGALNPEELKSFLNEWAAELNARAPKEGERESMKYAFLKRVKFLLDGPERPGVGFPGLEKLKTGARDKETAAATEADKKFWQNEVAGLTACIDAVKAASQGLDQTPEMPLWTDRTDGMVLRKLFEELEKLEAAYLALSKALQDRLDAVAKAEKTLGADGQAAVEDARKKLLKTITDLVGGNRDAKSGDAVPKEPGGLLSDLRKSEEDGPKSVAEKEIELKKELAEQREQSKRLQQFKTENDLRVRDLESRINWFRHRREEARERREPDGEIVGVENGRQIAYIDLLHKDRLFRGTKFRVYSPQRGGIKVDKAEIEVVEVRESGTSVCAVTRIIDASDPLRVGDRIYNEVFERGRPRYIAIAGRLTGRLSNDEAATLIRKFGDHYQDRVDQRTDFLVVGEGYDGPDGRAGTGDADTSGEDDDPNFRLARDWGVKIILERTLYEYLGVK
ncbi:MAG: hypothetical protein HYY17_02165 [Planctomycetes bacterium]|nr:hypothetical protein [Planctomycetota bacterium]